MLCLGKQFVSLVRRTVCSVFIFFFHSFDVFFFLEKKILGQGIVQQSIFVRILKLKKKKCRNDGTFFLGGREGKGVVIGLARKKLSWLVCADSWNRQISYRRESLTASMYAMLLYYKLLIFFFEIKRKRIKNKNVRLKEN